MSGPDDPKQALEYIASTLRKVEREIQALRDNHPTYQHALHDAEGMVSSAADDVEHAAERTP